MIRIFTALALLAVVIPVIRFAPVPLFWAGLGVLCVVAVLELRLILTRLRRPPWPVLSVAGSVAVMVCFAFDPPPLAPVLMAFLVLVLGRALASGQGPGPATDRLVGTLLPVLYLGLTMGHIGALLTLQLPGGARDQGDMLMLALVSVYIGDTFAYYGGRLLGRHRMAPGISPSKTIEGAACGLVGAVGGALLAPFWFAQAMRVTDAVALGLILGGAGILGDLAESMLKRAAELKDSGGWLPGHGGLLDRIDSLLLAAPALYWYHRIVLSG